MVQRDIFYKKKKKLASFGYNFHITRDGNDARVVDQYNNVHENFLDYYEHFHVQIRQETTRVVQPLLFQI